MKESRSGHYPRVLYEEGIRLLPLALLLVAIAAILELIPK
jgi:hypothetical protein